MTTCKTCKYWGGRELHGDAVSEHKSCNAPQIQYGYWARPEGVPDNGAYIEDDEGWGMMTGPDFGCVLHAEVEPSSDGEQDNRSQSERNDQMRRLLAAADAVPAKTNYATYTHPCVKFVAYYPRKLSELECLIVISNDWHRLANVEPTVGQVCRYIVVHPDWPSGDEVSTGTFFPADGYSGPVFATAAKGLFVGDPKHTYWQAI